MPKTKEKKTKKTKLEEAVGPTEVVEPSQLILDQIDALMLPTKRIVRSGRNARADMGDLTELKESIASVGILQPLVVRRVDDQYELISGERRLTAAEELNLSEVPCIVRKAGDAEADLMRAVENLQRVNLNELEEAVDMARLQESGKTVPEIAAAVGKSMSFVHQRLQLNKLSATAKEEFLKGKFSASHAVELARMPKGVQDKLAQGWAIQGSLKQFEEHIAREYTLPLSRCGFDQKSLTLLPKAGACTDCPKNTTNYVPAPGEEPPTKGRCTDKPCYERKRAAHMKAEVARIEKVEGKKLIPISTSYGKSNGAKLDSQDYRTAKKGDANAVPAVVVYNGGYGSHKEGDVLYIVPKDLKKAKAEQMADEAKRQRQNKVRDELQERLDEHVDKSWPKEANSTLVRLLILWFFEDLYGDIDGKAKEVGVSLKPAAGDEEVQFQILMDALVKAPEADLPKWALAFAPSINDVDVSQRIAAVLGFDTAKVKAEIEAKYPQPTSPETSQAPDSPKKKAGKVTPSDPAPEPEPELEGQELVDEIEATIPGDDSVALNTLALGDHFIADPGEVEIFRVEANYGNEMKVVEVHTGESKTVPSGWRVWPVHYVTPPTPEPAAAGEEPGSPTAIESSSAGESSSREDAPAAAGNPEEEPVQTSAAPIEDCSDASAYEPHEAKGRKFLAQFAKGRITLYEIANKAPLHGGKERKLADGENHFSKVVLEEDAPSADPAFEKVARWIEELEGGA